VCSAVLPASCAAGSSPAPPGSGGEPRSRGQEILAAWIGKEKLRDVLNLRARVTGSTPCEREVRGQLFTFYDWCSRHDDIPELPALARTISRWEDELAGAVLTE